MVGPRIEIQRPARRLGAEIFLLTLDDEPVSEHLDVELIPVKLSRTALEIRLDIGQQLSDLHGPGDKLDAAPVAEAIFERGAAAGALRHRGFESSPVADDLCEPLLIVRQPRA